jgi:hypothetical protein
VAADETRLSPEKVYLQSGIEPIVQLIERTPRGELIEVVAQRVKRGLSYQELLAGLLLAGVRNVQPRPAVGFKFHSVLVVNSAHLASLASNNSDRWLPIFWALDYFKSTQLEEERTSGWKLQPVDESKVPTSRKARKAFVEAMDRWDPEAADVAVAGLARTTGANELFELFCRYGARDFRSIGHKAIYVANSFRTLQCIGWQHAEPVLRSLAYALLNHSGEENPAENDLGPDRPWRLNLELQADIPNNWQDGTGTSESTRSTIHSLREGTPESVCREAVSMLAKNKVGPSVMWDAILLGAGELLMQQPGIVGLHSLTTANALHYAYMTSGNDQTRRMLLLQACAYLPMFREAARARGNVKEETIEDLLAAVPDAAVGSDSLEEIFSAISHDRPRAAQLLYSYMKAGGDAQQVLTTARREIFLKGKDAHDYKFSSAVLEDFYHVGQPLRNEYLAMSVFNLKGSDDKENGLVQRIREALDA